MLLLWLLILPLLACADTRNSYTPDDLSTVLASLSGILKFFSRNSHQVNLDAVLGTRIIEGQTKVLAERLMQNRSSTELDVVIDEISRLHEASRIVSNWGEANVKLEQPGYYKKLWRIISEGFWELNYDSRDFDDGVVLLNQNPTDHVREGQSDNCMAEILGSTDVPKCSISDYCWSLMTNPNFRGYSLTHEVIYLQIGELMGCTKDMEMQSLFHGQPSPQKMMTMFCKRTMEDAQSIVDDGFSDEQQDLFMEQIGICGMLGFRQFAQKAWLPEILSWQRPLGCFGLFRNFVKDFKEHGFDVLHLFPPGESYDSQRGTSPWQQLIRSNSGHRQKREEKRMSYDCLAHKTAVAGVALVSYVRFIIEDLIRSGYI